MGECFQLWNSGASFRPPVSPILEAEYSPKQSTPRSEQASSSSGNFTVSAESGSEMLNQHQEEFCVTFSASEWQDMLDKNGDKLRKNWTDVMVEKIREHLKPSCVLTFLSASIKKRNSRKRAGYY